MEVLGLGVPFCSVRIADVTAEYIRNITAAEVTVKSSCIHAMETCGRGGITLIIVNLGIS